MLPVYQGEHILGAVLHFAFNLKAGTTNWHFRKGGRWDYPAAQAMLSPPWGCGLGQQPIHVWGRLLSQKHGDSRSRSGTAGYFVRWQVMHHQSGSWMPGWEMSILKLPVPEVDTQILLLLSLRLILNMFEAKLNSNISYSGVCSEHWEMFKV